MANSGKIILVTGASSGMGKVTAIELIKQGHTVYCAARSVDKMQELVDLGGHALSMDMSNPADLIEGMDRIMTEQGRMDVLWNNAGFGLYGPVEEIPMEKARYQFEVSLFGDKAYDKIIMSQMK